MDYAYSFDLLCDCPDTRSVQRRWGIVCGALQNDTDSRRPKYPVDNHIQVHFVHHWNAAVVRQKPVFVCED